MRTRILHARAIGELQMDLVCRAVQLLRELPAYQGDGLVVSVTNGAAREGHAGGGVAATLNLDAEGDDNVGDAFGRSLDGGPFDSL